jgi:hypothetical protein
VFRADKVRGTPTAFPFRAGITRRAPGAVGLSGPPVVYSIVKSARHRLRTKRTIREQWSGVKRAWCDFLDRRFVARYLYLVEREGRSLGNLPWEYRAVSLRKEEGVTLSPKWSLPPSFLAWVGSLPQNA